MSEVIEKGKLAKEASYKIARATTEEKNEVLQLISEQLLKDQPYILEENDKDIQYGRGTGLSEAILDRIQLNEDRIQGIATSLQQVTELKDPIGDVLETMEHENGLVIEKRRVPIGVVGMIYEARPNVTIDAAALTLKTGNAVILRGSSSAKYSNMAIVRTIHQALEKSALPKDAVQLIEDTSRATASELFTLNDYLDVLIPRGSQGLIDTVVKQATVPVIETGAGNCHVYVDASAKKDMAEEIVLNAKLQRPSVCNAIESLLVERNWFNKNGKELLEKLLENNVEVYAEAEISDQVSGVNQATEEDFATEYLGLKISVKLVDDVKEAVDHINKYGTHHSEAIVTEDEASKEYFLQNVDATTVYHNASTRFTDGFEFGYGAEIGISTQKLHARGPMGLNALTSSKFFVLGTGQVRN